jgi:hypothetical protein
MIGDRGAPKTPVPPKTPKTPDVPTAAPKPQPEAENKDQAKALKNLDEANPPPSGE